MGEVYKIRLARGAEWEFIALIEMSANEKFRDWPGFGFSAGVGYPRFKRWKEAVTAARMFVLVDETDRPIGLTELNWLGDEPFLGGPYVAEPHQGRGPGKILLAHAYDWAREHGAQTLLLSTRRDVPWNAPYYARRGFAEIPPTDYELPAIKERRDLEARFLDMSQRLIMRKVLT